MRTANGAVLPRVGFGVLGAALVLGMASGTAWSQEDAAVASAPAPAASDALISPKATFAISGECAHRGQEIWSGNPGFLNGLRGFEHFYEPIGQPLYFESPFNTSGIRFLYLWHQFSDGSQLQGGQVNVFAAQARLALTERLGFIATKDGYSILDTGIGISEEGWNDLAAGLKYAFYVDREADMVINAGARLTLTSGESKILQNETEELSPFISIAKGWDKFHVIGSATFRLPFDDDDGNQVLHWDLHADYEVLDGFAPVVEIHGLHYLSDGNRLPLSVGGLDYANFGSSDVSGSSVIWAGVGGRVKFTPHTSMGATYEFALTDADDDIMDERITVDFQLTW